MNNELFSYGIAYIVIVIVVTIIIILICRELVAWYTKRNQQLKKANEQIANQKTIIELLKEQNQLLKSISNMNDKNEEVKKVEEDKKENQSE